MIIKVCGMRKEANIREVEQLGVDWMGFIFYPASPRYVGDALSYIPEKVKRVGVFVHENRETLLAISEKNRLDILQLHGNESPEDCQALKQRGFSVIKAFGMNPEKTFSFELTDRYEGCCDYFLFDRQTSQYGGSGKKFDWKLLDDYRGEIPFLLSGGISPDDAAAIKGFSHPRCIGFDLNSGFETSPAVKNAQDLRLFIERLRHSARNM